MTTHQSRQLRLLLGFIVSLGLALAFVMAIPSTATAAVPDPPTGSNAWHWHTKTFSAPFSDCVAKVGWADHQGYMYFKRTIDCKAEATAAYQLGSSLYVERNGSLVINADFKSCGNGQTTPIGACTWYSTKPNPSGNQKWNVTMQGQVNFDNVANIPWFAYYS